MLKSITFGTFYFFLVFCLILIVWVYFCVPETKGLRIEEMDKIFGGNQGAEDIARIEDIRRRLGATPIIEATRSLGDGSDEKSLGDEEKMNMAQVTHHEA
jgi:hypothetical protein